MILATGSEASTRAVFAALLDDATMPGNATDGTVLAARLRASYVRILALKARL